MWPQYENCIRKIISIHPETRKPCSAYKDEQISETGETTVKNGNFAALVLLTGLPVPAGAHTGDLAAGKGIGFAVMVYDWDETTGSWEYFTAIQTERPYTDLVDLRANVFLDGLLLPADPAGTAVEGSTWGRIKASLGK